MQRGDKSTKLSDLFKVSWYPTHHTQLEIFYVIRIATWCSCPSSSGFIILFSTSSVIDIWLEYAVDSVIPLILLENRSTCLLPQVWLMSQVKCQLGARWRQSEGASSSGFIHNKFSYWLKPVKSLWSWLHTSSLVLWELGMIGRDERRVQKSSWKATSGAPELIGNTPQLFTPKAPRISNRISLHLYHISTLRFQGLMAGLACKEG